MKSVSVSSTAGIIGIGTLLLAGCASVPDSERTEPTAESAVAETKTSAYLGNYDLVDQERGTITTVTVSDGVREITTNALPNHETGDFPNPGNPNTISAQENVWTFPSEASYTGTARSVKVTGIGLNGIKFDPGTAERVTCTSGEVYNLEGLQEISDLGMDFNNAHVQPDGEYHYHGISELLVDLYDSGDDLVLVGFAADGHLMYYSKSGQYSSSYQLIQTERQGEGCTYQAPLGGEAISFGAVPDGSLTQDWEYVAGSGDLDQCNGLSINGQYSYVLTDNYPYIPRCLMGEFEETFEPPANMGQMPGGQQGPPRQ